MTITVDAIYEGGVLKPAQPLPLGEQEKVRVTVVPHVQPVTAQQTPPEPEERTGLSLAERIAARARALPAEVVDAWPTDGAAQHDHYLYGTPKRPE